MDSDLDRLLADSTAPQVKPEPNMGGDGGGDVEVSPGDKNNGMYGIVVLSPARDKEVANGRAAYVGDKCLRLKGGGGTACLGGSDCHIQRRGQQGKLTVSEPTIFVASSAGQSGIRALRSHDSGKTY